ncbi:MAG: calcium-binding protein [Pseudomonadota bacterium]
MTGPSLGTNLSGLEDWSTSFAFVNQFQMTRNWFTQSATEWDTGDARRLDLDENGWVRGFTRNGSEPPFDHVSTIWQTNGQEWRPGIYVLDWKGEGQVTIGGDATLLTNESGRITFRLNGPGAVTINLLSTDPNDTGNYLRDMRLYHSQDADLIEAGMIFNPAYLDRIEDFRTLRFMDWMQTNNSTVDGVEDMRPFEAARQTGPGGASVAMMVELANQTRSDPWFNIPHLADEAYIRAFATYVRDNLDEGLVARFEYSNEVWNWGFAQAQWAQAQAEATWGPDVEGGWMQWYGRQAAIMANIVADVFGDETGTRALNVFSTQSGWQGLEYYALNAPDLVADGGTAPMEAPFHVYAIAAYFGGSMGLEENAGLVDQWLTMGEAGYRAAIAYIRSGPGSDSLPQIGATVAYHARVAEFLGWALEGYEGGQHVVDLAGLFGGVQDPEQTEFFINLVRRPEFEQLYTRYFDIWQANGGGLMAQFSDFGIPSRYGSWGIWDSVYSAETPRSLAVQAYRDGVQAWWADPRDASTFEDGLQWVDTDGRDALSGTELADAVFGLMGDDRLSGRGGDDLIHGGQGFDMLLGAGGDDRLLGGMGSDSLYGGDGNDWLDGGASGDTLTGGNGDDTLIGGMSSDVLTGGTGADVFQFFAGDGGAVITDFRKSVDRLALDQALIDPGDTAADVVAAYARVYSGGVILAFDDGTRIILADLTSTSGLAASIDLI